MNMTGMLFLYTTNLYYYEVSLYFILSPVFGQKITCYKIVFPVQSGSQVKDKGTQHSQFSVTYNKNMLIGDK